MDKEAASPFHNPASRAKAPRGGAPRSAAPPPPRPEPKWRVKLRLAYEHVRRLQGDPHYVAMGMGIGVFVAVTPTIPFHTIIAIALAFVLRGSKPAAVVGVWFSNPVTIPFLYYGSYKIGALVMGMDLPAEIPYESITDMLDLGFDVTLAMMVGGCVLGILPAIIAYSLTWRLVCRLRKDGICDTRVPAKGTCPQPGIACDGDAVPQQRQP